MEYTLTEHARKRIAQRRIDLAWIEAALEEPNRIESDVLDPTLVHALRVIPEREFRVLRVIYNEQKEPLAIVTAYFDDGVNDL